FWRAADNPNGLAPPLDSHLLSWLKLADIDSHRGTGRLRFGARVPGGHKRHGSSDDPYPADNRSCPNEKTTPALIHVAMIHTGRLPLGNEGLQRSRAASAKLETLQVQEFRHTYYVMCPADTRTALLYVRPTALFWTCANKLSQTIPPS